MKKKHNILFGGVVLALAWRDYSTAQPCLIRGRTPDDTSSAFDGKLPFAAGTQSCWKIQPSKILGRVDQQTINFTANNGGEHATLLFLWLAMEILFGDGGSVLSRSDQRNDKQPAWEGFSSAMASDHTSWNLHVVNDKKMPSPKITIFHGYPWYNSHPQLQPHTGAPPSAKEPEAF